MLLFPGQVAPEVSMVQPSSSRVQLSAVLILDLIRDEKRAFIDRDDVGNDRELFIEPCI